jgi:hypothetical protein
LPITTTFPSRPPAMMSPSPSTHSPTLPWTTTSSQTSSSPATRPPPPFKSTRSPL